MITPEMRDVLRKLLTQVPMLEILGELRLLTIKELAGVRQIKELSLEVSAEGRGGTTVYNQACEEERKLVVLNKQTADLYGYFAHENFYKVGLDVPTLPAGQQLPLGL